MNRLLLVLLCASLLVNAALLAWRPRASVPLAEVAASEPRPVTTPVNPAALRQNRQSLRERFPSPAPAQTDLRSDPFVAASVRLRENLLGAGYSARVVVETLRDLYRIRREALETAYLGPERAAALAQRGDSKITAEQKMELQAISVKESAGFSIILPETLRYEAQLQDPKIRLEWERSLGGCVPWEKYAETIRLDLEYGRIAGSIQTDDLTPEARSRIFASLEREKRQDLEQLFTVEELEEWDMRSPLLRISLGDREVSEEEYRRLFRADRERRKLLGQRLY